LRLDLTHFDTVIEGVWTKGWNDDDILPNITCPTLFITDNSWTDDEGTQSLQYNLSTIKDSKHVTVDIHNHRVHEMRPSAYLREVERFLKPLIAYEK